MKGDGTFAAPITGEISIAVNPNAVSLGDFNGDGILDKITGGDATIVSLGKGDGTFQYLTDYDQTGTDQNPSLFDINNDGKLDLIALTGFGGVSVLLGKGDGTFGAGSGEKVSNLGGTANSLYALGDINGDGFADIVFTNGYDIKVGIGNADGTFSNIVTLTGHGDDIVDIKLGDIDNNGSLDIVVSSSTSHNEIQLFQNNGGGIFNSRKDYYASPFEAGSIALGDINNDGFLDLVGADGGSELISMLGTATGFDGATTNFLSSGIGPKVLLSDINGDGKLDIVHGGVNDGGSFSFLFGKGNGDFTDRGYTYSAGLQDFALGDINNDGAVDIVTAKQSGVGSSAYLGNTESGVAALLPLSLRTQAGALQALPQLQHKLDQLTSQRGTLGAFESRITFATNTLTSAKTEFDASVSRILDADIAADSAELTRLQIVQRAGAAALAQANLNPQIAKKLLQN